MQVLGTFLGIGKTFTMLTAGIYRTIAFLYNDLMSLVNIFKDTPLNKAMESLVSKVYTLVGIFMLFRIAISLLNYLINPDKLNDGKVGGKTLVIHIVTSVILLVSLNTIIFPTFAKIQDALLDSNGILYNLSKNILSNTKNNINVQSLSYSSVDNTLPIKTLSLVPTVNAADSLTCYYHATNYNSNTGSQVGTTEIGEEVSITFSTNNTSNSVYESTFGGKKESGYYWSSNKLVSNRCYSNGTITAACSDSTGARILGSNSSISSSLGSGTCPKTISNVYCKDGQCYFTANTSLTTNLSNSDAGSGGNNITFGRNSSSESSKAAMKSATSSGSSTVNDSTVKDQIAEVGKYDGKITADSLKFSINLLTPFVSPKKVFAQGCDKELVVDSDGYIVPESNACGKFLTTRGTNENDTYSTQYWAKQIEDGESSDGITYSMDWLLAILCAIAVFVIIFVICIQVVIRDIKMVFLQAIAPIPVLSYMNPSDKLLSNWFKQYIGNFFSLFLYLITIQLVPPLMFALLKSIPSSNILLTIVVILGCLLFMKEAPKFVSNILGIENMAGSFGDAFKMVKTGLGIGVGAAAGAAIGGVTGAVSGFGTGGSLGTVLGGIAGGASRGLKSGAKGKVMAGAKTQAQRNASIKDANQNGSSWSDRMLARVGINTTKSLDDQVKGYKRVAQENQLAVDYADKAKSFVTGELDKGKGEALSGSTYAKNYRLEKDKLAHLDANRKNISRSAFSSENEYRGALNNANKAYEDQYQKFYVSAGKDANGNSLKGINDLAVEEFYNTATGNEELNNIKTSFNIEKSAYGDTLADVDVNDWGSVKAGKETHAATASNAKANASAIENSSEYLGKKASQDAVKKK